MLVLCNPGQSPEQHRTLTPFPHPHRTSMALSTKVSLCWFLHDMTESDLSQTEWHKFVHFNDSVSSDTWLSSQPITQVTSDSRVFWQLHLWKPRDLRTVWDACPYQPISLALRHRLWQQNKHQTKCTVHVYYMYNNESGQFTTAWPILHISPIHVHVCSDAPACKWNRPAPFPVSSWKLTATVSIQELSVLRGSSTYPLYTCKTINARSPTELENYDIA